MFPPLAFSWIHTGSVFWIPDQLNTDIFLVTWITGFSYSRRNWASHVRKHTLDKTIKRHEQSSFCKVHHKTANQEAQVSFSSYLLWKTCSSGYRWDPVLLRSKQFFEFMSQFPISIAHDSDRNPKNRLDVFWAQLHARPQMEVLCRVGGIFRVAIRK